MPERGRYVCSKLGQRFRLSIDAEHGYGPDVPRASRSRRFGGPVGNFKPRFGGAFLYRLLTVRGTGWRVRRDSPTRTSSALAVLPTAGAAKIFSPAPEQTPLQRDWRHDVLQRVIGETNMLALFAMNFHAARLGFEAQNAMAFRLLRLVSDTNKPASPEILTAEIVEPPAVRAPATKVAPAGTRRASASKVHKKTTRAKKVTKRSK
jgi:hypothetical protein